MQSPGTARARARGYERLLLFGAPRMEKDSMTPIKDRLQGGG